MNEETTDRPSLEILKEYAELSGYSIFSDEIIIAHAGFKTLPITKRQAHIPLKMENMHFVWYSNPGIFSNYSMYCGILFPCPIDSSIRLQIKKKWFINRINSIITNKYHITGEHHFDSQVLISGTGFTQFSKILSTNSVQNSILDIFRFDQRARIEVNFYNERHFNDIPESTGISVFIYNDWLFNAEKINELIHLTTVLKNYIFSSGALGELTIR